MHNIRLPFVAIRSQQSKYCLLKRTISKHPVHELKRMYASHNPGIPHPKFSFLLPELRFFNRADARTQPQQTRMSETISASLQYAGTWPSLTDHQVPLLYFAEAGVISAIGPQAQMESRWHCLRGQFRLSPTCSLHGLHDHNLLVPLRCWHLGLVRAALGSSAYTAYMNSSGHGWSRLASTVSIRIHPSVAARAAMVGVVA